MSASLRTLAVLMLAGSACRKEPTEVAAVRAAEVPTVPAALATIESFDCGSSLVEKRGELVRAMQLGGPGGAAWNWDSGELVCIARVALHCQVQPTITISAGDHAEMAQVSLPSPELAVARASFAPAIWQPLLQSGTQPFSTLRMRARVEGSCIQGDNKAGRKLSATDEFNAGFASGE